MKIGAQTYTLYPFIQTDRDFAESMKRVSDIGYRIVQISGIGSIKARTVRHICDDNGLQIVLTHTSPEQILNETDTVIEDHNIMGCDYIGIGGMPERYRNIAWIDRFAEDFAVPAKAIKQAGKKLMYHNHNFEWEKLPNGQTLWDTLMTAMPADLMGVTLDTYWVQAAGADIYAVIDSLIGRLECVHLKDMKIIGTEQRFAPIGDGNLNFHEILKKFASANTKYMLVEQDACYGQNPFDCLKRSFDYLKGLGY